MHHDIELVTSLSDEELETMANSTPAPPSQTRLDELLDENIEHRLDADGKAELECLLARVNQLTIVKTRARYTLRQQTKATGGTWNCFQQFHGPRRSHGLANWESETRVPELSLKSRPIAENARGFTK